MKDVDQKLVEAFGEGRILRNETLSKYSSFHLGGNADYFFRAKTQSELLCAIKIAFTHKLPVFIMGGGTNLLISDKGFRGLVIKNETGGIRIVGLRGSINTKKEGAATQLNSVFLEVDSGVGVNRLVRFTIEQGLSGLEVFLGQPGTVGGGLYINAHNMSAGKFISDSLFSAKLTTKEGKVKEVSREFFKFGYDKSTLQETHEIVLSAVFRLASADKSELWKRAQEALEHRRRTQPQGVFSSGCTFRNIEKSDAVRIAAPQFTTSAGFLLESVGLKGRGAGGARFSDSHANFIVNEGGAKADDVLKLINLAKKKVKDKYGVNLKEEVVLVGDF